MLTDDEVIELQQKVVSLESYIQNVDKLQKAKSNLSQQAKNLSALKLFLETVLLAKEVSAVFNKSVEISADLMPIGLIVTENPKVESVVEDK